MAEPRLNQVIAAESAIKTRVDSFVTAVYHAAQKPALFDGMTRTYQPLQEGAERLPQETKLVQQRAADLLRESAIAFTELMDAIATKDYANTQAVGDVVVDGAVLLERVPSTYLIWLEKKLVDIHTLVSKLPVLDPAEAWQPDANDGLYKTDVTETARTLKVQEPIVLHPPTKEHPAQTAVINKDIIVGYYQAVRVSGALPLSDQRRILRRVETLQRAVKFAREQANMTMAPQKDVGGKVFDYLLK